MRAAHCVCQESACTARVERVTVGGIYSPHQQLWNRERGALDRQHGAFKKTPTPAQSLCGAGRIIQSTEDKDAVLRLHAVPSLLKSQHKNRHCKPFHIPLLNEGGTSLFAVP